MSEAATYSAGETLRDGRRVEIRALRPDDRADLIAAVGRTSADSFYRRFFGVRHAFTEREIASYLNIDFIGHVALVAVADEGGRPTIVGGGRYVVVQPGTAEVAFAVIHASSGQYLLGVNPGVLFASETDNTAFFLPLTFGYRAY